MTAENLTAAVRAALAGVKDPEIRRPITDLGMVDSIDVSDNGIVELTVLLTIAACPLRDKLTEDVTAAVRAVPGVTEVRLTLGVMTDAQRSTLRDNLKGGATKDIPFARAESRTRVYAIASGKGGVGKSTVTVNLAASLAAKGLAVGRPRRGCLRLLHPADARGDRQAHPDRRDDPAAGGARGEGDQRRNVRRRQHPGGVARPDAAPRPAAVPGRRVLG